MLIGSIYAELRSWCAAEAQGQLAELRARIARHARHGETTAIDGGLVSAADKPNEPAASTSGTVVALIAQGAKRLAIGDRVYDYRAGQYLVASVDLPITGHYSQASATEPALGFGLVLRSSAIASLLLDAPAPISPESPRRDQAAAAPPGLGVADVTPELFDAVARMLRLLDSPSDRDVLAPTIEREILWRLMTGPLGQSVRQIGLADSRLTQISRAVRWITDHHSEPFRVADLARSCGMSTSAFHPQLPRSDRTEPDPVPKTNPSTEITPSSHVRGTRRGDHRIPRRIRQSLTVQPRIPPPIRPAPGTRRRAPTREHGYVLSCSGLRRGGRSYIHVAGHPSCRRKL